MILAAGEALAAQLTVEKNRFESVDDLQKFIAMQANEVVLTKARSITVEQPHSDLESLYQELVGSGASTMSEALAESGPWNKSVMNLKRTLSRLASEQPKLVQEKPRIAIPNSKITIRPAYSYINGHLNIIELHEIKTKEQTIENHAFRYGGESEYIAKHLSNDLGTPVLIVVSTPRKQHLDLHGAESLMNEVLKDYEHAKLIPEFRNYLRKVDFVKMAQDLREIESEAVQHMVNRIPEQWEVPEEARTALVRMICSRSQYLSENLVRLTEPHCYGGELLE